VFAANTNTAENTSTQTNTITLFAANTNTSESTSSITGTTTVFTANTNTSENTSQQTTTQTAFLANTNTNTTRQTGNLGTYFEGEGGTVGGFNTNRNTILRNTTTATLKNTNTNTTGTTNTNTTASLTSFASTSSSSQSFVCFEFIANTYYGTSVSGGVPAVNSNVYAQNNTTFPLAAGWYGATTASGFAPDTRFRIVGTSGQVQAVQSCPGGFSDRRLKKNIRQYGKSNNGINIYLFEYVDEKYGKGVYQGVMADEVEHIKGAVTEMANGYKWVNYGIKEIDVEFKKI
tara:strand:+ start:2271 stop:3137 length:867 start_codon:yes stop_codon:yes gene_type:complete